MTRFTLVWCCLWFSLTVGCGAVQRPDGGRGLLTVGASVPTLTGSDQNGAAVQLKFPAPGLTVVYFYPRDSTPGCTKEACAFRDIWSKYEAAHIRVLGVSSNDVESHLEFSKEHQLPFALVADESGDWARAFGVPSLAGIYSRVTFLVGQDGRVLDTYENVDPGLHANEILKDAQRLGNLGREATLAPNPKSETAGDDALLAPAPRLPAQSAPSVGLRLHLGVSPDPALGGGLWIAAELTPPAGAHLFWQHAGESGLPTRIEFFAPSGYQVGPARYPGPTRFRGDTGRSAVGYTGPVVVLSKVTSRSQSAAAAPNGEPLSFRVDGSWLSCDTRCTKEEVHETLTWDGSPRTLPHLGDWLGKLPNPDVPDGFGARLNPERTQVVLTAPEPWRIDDAFIAADLAIGDRLPVFTQNQVGQASLTPVTNPPPETVVVRAVSRDEPRYFEVRVTHPR